MNHDGIALTRTGASWVSVSNPFRSPATPGGDLESDQLHARAGGAGIAAGALVAVIVLLAGAGVGIAALCGFAVIAPVWFGTYRALAARNNRQLVAASTEEQSFGPQRLTRGHLVSPPLAATADDLVMASVAILQSTAARTGALGHPSDVYQDIIESTWVLLWRLVQLDQDVRKLDRGLDRIAELTDLSEMAAEIDYLTDEHLAVYRDLEPLVADHLSYADAVADIDEQLAIPAAQEQLTALTRSRIDDMSPAENHEGLGARVHAAEQVIEAHTKDADHGQTEPGEAHA